MPHVWDALAFFLNLETDYVNKKNISNNSNQIEAKIICEPKNGTKNYTI